VQLVPLVREAQLAYKVQQDQMVLLEILVQQVQLVIQVLRVFKAQLVFQDQQQILALLV
jgi:hypothetical protein